MIAPLKKTLLRLCAGKKRFQPFFSALHRASLIGMNIGAGAKIEESGELTALRFVAEQLPGQPVTIFDVGALHGEYTLHALDIFGAGCQVFSFEPSRTAFAKLRTGLAQYPQAHPHNIALSDTSGTATLFSKPDNPGLSSLYDRRLDHFNRKLDTREDVEVTTIDQFCQDNHIEHIGLLKLDVEGNELKCLAGSRGMLAAGRIDFIQFEFGGGNIDSRTYFQDFYYLLHPQYRIYRILKDGVQEIEKYEERHEIFTTTNYLAQRRPS